MPRVELSEDIIEDAFEKVILKFQEKLKEKGKMSLCSTHECLGLINEEHNELIEAVRSNSPEEFEEEMTDVGVCVILSLASKYAGGLDW